jgi:hypothetical protein
MGSPADFEARLAAVESRLEEVAADAAAARHLAAARDRDLADLTVKVDSIRSTLNGFGVQTAARFDLVDQRFDLVDRRFELVDRRFDRLEQRVDSLENKVDIGFMEMRAKFDQTAAGMEQIVELLTQRDDQG